MSEESELWGMPTEQYLFLTTEDLGITTVIEHLPWIDIWIKSETIKNYN